MIDLALIEWKVHEYWHNSPKGDTLTASLSTIACMPQQSRRYYTHSLTWIVNLVSVMSCICSLIEGIASSCNHVMIAWYSINHTLWVQSPNRGGSFSWIVNLQKMLEVSIPSNIGCLIEDSTRTMKMVDECIHWRRRGSNDQLHLLVKRKDWC